MTIYTCENTFEAMMTCIYDAWASKEIIYIFFQISHVVPPILFNIVPFISLLSN